MARALGVEQYGLLQYTLGLVAAFSSISFICGAEVLVPPLVTATPAERKRLMGNAFVLRQAASVVAYICLLIFAWVAEDRGNFLLIALMGMTMLLDESFGVVTLWMQSQTDIKARTLLSFISLSVRLAFVATLYYLKVKDTMAYSLFYFFNSIILAIGLLFIYRHKTNDFWFQFNLKDFIKLLESGLPFWFGLMIMNIYQRIDIIMLKHFSDNYNIGIYSAALQLMAPITYIASVLSISFAPRYVYGQCNEKTALKNIGLIVLFMLTFALLTAAIARFGGEIILPILFGEKFKNSIPIFNAIVWVICLIFVDSALNLFLIKNQQGKIIALKWLFALLTSLVIHFIFIPKYKSYGAVAGYAAGYMTACIFGFVLFRQAGIKKT